MEDKKTRLGYALALTKYIEGYRIPLFFSVLSNLIFKLLPLVISIVTSYMISDAVLGDGKSIWNLFFTVILLVILDVVFSYLDILISHDMAYRILTRLREKAYDKIDEIAPAAMEDSQSGNLISVIIYDIELLEWFYAHTITQVIVAIVVPMAALVFMGCFSVILPMIMIPFILLLLITARWKSKEANEQGVKVRKATGVINALIIDGIQGLKDITTYRWQKRFFEKFLQATKEYNEASLAYSKRSAKESRQFGFIIGVAGLCCNLVTVLLIIHHRIDATWLMPLFVVSVAVFAPIQEALSMSTNYGMIFGAAKRVFELFQRKSYVLDSGSKEASEIVSLNQETESCFQEESMIHMDDITFTYPAQDKGMERNQVLNQFSLKVKKGETVALVGHSGCGKTTVARLLQRFWDVDSGEIKIGGINIREFSLQALRDVVTVVSQETYLFNRSIEENLRLVKPNITWDEIREVAKEARADIFIERLPKGYDTIVGEKGIRLSGGEKQRLAIMQALLKNSPILILDEASANLDSENEAYINAALRQLKQGKTTLVIAHRLSTIQSADRIAFIQEGRIEGFGTYEELVQGNAHFCEMIGGDVYE